MSHFRRAGANAKKAGRSFEEEIEATNQAYSRMGLATIARAHPPVGGPPTALFYKGKGQVDFVGTVRGISVAFDTKTEAGAASYKHDADEMHQLDFLLDWRSKGGVAFLLLLDRERDTVYLVDHLAALRDGKSVPLRSHVRSKSGAQPFTHAVVRTESERLLDKALGRPVWPWLELAAQHDPRIASLLTSAA